ncbi:MAG: Fe2+-dependent dioxygenase [Betaproteobacteria bacterium]
MLLQIPTILNREELARLRAALVGAPFDPGTVTSLPGGRSAKHNLQLRHDSEVMRSCAPIVLGALQRSPTFFSAALPNKTFGLMFNRYDAGMDYGDHLDTALVAGASTMRSDIAATLFLNPPEDYDGGELVIQDSFGAHRVKLPAGSMIVYPASSLHRVEPVRRGSRLAAVFWVQSLVRDESRRRILFEVDLVIGKLAKSAPGSAEFQSLSGVYHNLLRMWAET